MLESLRTIINGDLLVKNSIASKLIKSASNESIRLVSGGPVELISQNGDQASFLALGEFTQCETFRIFLLLSSNVKSIWTIDILKFTQINFT